MARPGGRQGAQISGLKLAHVGNVVSLWRLAVGHYFFVSKWRQG